MSITSINTNVESMMSRAVLARLETAMNRTMSHISSGSRLTSAADDPSAIAIYNRGRGELGGIRTAITNTQESLSMLNAADMYMNVLMDNLISCRDLAVRAANDATMDATTRAVLSTEYSQLRTNAMNLTSVTFNNVNLLDATAGTGLAAAAGLDVQAGPSSGDALNVKITNGINGNQIGGQAWAQATISANVTAANTAMTELDNVIKAWSGEMSSLGGQMRVVQLRLNELQSREVNMNAVVSQVGDADMSEEISEFTKLQIVASTATAMIAQANVMPSNTIQKLLQTI